MKFILSAPSRGIKFLRFERILCKNQGQLFRFNSNGKKIVPFCLVKEFDINFKKENFFSRLKRLGKFGFEMFIIDPSFRLKEFDLGTVIVISK